MRYMKVVAQESVVEGINVASRTVGFYDSAENEVVYAAKIDRFGNVQKLSAGNNPCEALVARIEQFMSRSALDMKRMFDWNHRGNQHGKSVELIAQGHDAERVAASVKFRFLAEDGQIKGEVTLSPETEAERMRRAELASQGATVATSGKKTRNKKKPGSVYPETQDTGFMNRLCRSYIELNW